MKPRIKTDNKLRLFNDFLSAIVIILAIYIIFAPLLPEAELVVEQATDTTGGYKYESELAREDPNVKEPDLKPIPKDNTLVIPTIGVDGKIYEGESSLTLNKGLWRRPSTSIPPLGGNTVIIAHRYLYTEGPNTFYHLDKVKVGDKFIIFWEGKEYDYEVYDVKIVPPTAVEIENNTKDPIVTLYTCTPLWTAKNRLVVRGKLINQT